MVMMSPEPTPANPFDFRAPPPSPIGTGRRSCFTNDDVLTDFLEHSLRVPDLVLPDNIFPRQRFIESPPRIDFRSIESSHNDSILRILDSMSSIGCFQLVNHGIPVELIGSVSAAAATGVFGVSPEKKAAVARSPEKAYGFEEYWHGEDESELSEEFVWSRDERLKMEMEAISPFGYSNFSKKMEALTEVTEKLGEKMLEIFRESCGKEVAEKEGHGSVWCVYKQKQRVDWDNDEWENCLKHDVIRMLIRGTDFSHAFSFHFCHGSSSSSPLFHVYSKRGWVSFVPDQSAIIVAVGDLIQAWSGGQHKHVIGRPIYRDNKKEENGNSKNINNGISLAFLFSPTSISSSSSSVSPQPPIEIKTLSLAHQALFALFFSLFFTSFCSTFSNKFSFHNIFYSFPPHTVCFLFICFLHFICTILALFV